MTFRARVRVLWITMISVVLLALGSLVPLPVTLVYNASASAPIGFYWIARRPIRLGDFVLVTLPDKVELLAVARGYLPPDIPVVKQVAGLAGDTVCRVGSRIFINGGISVIALSHDPSDRPMPVWSGCRRLRQGEIFLLNSEPRSFDGRYFGPVERQRVVGVAIFIDAFWLWNDREAAMASHRAAGGAE